MAPRNTNPAPANIPPNPEGTQPMGETNREVVESTALALMFSDEKAATLIDVKGYGSKAGAVSYSSIRSHLKKTEPKLTGAALTERVKKEMNGYDAQALVAVLQLNREGFKFQRIAGRELKSGVKNVSIKMSNGGDKGDKAKLVKLEDMTVEQLEAVLAARKQAATETERTVDIEAAK